ncbi:trypsin-like peptidase domain-containing protein [Streptomyces sp. NPDC001848]|uniref:trypsin-like serine peptidase n=1 Tax=Streptomyces sp. NPDC001848 TaxID=3364618 RepID=UPI00368E0B5E
MTMQRATDSGRRRTGGARYRRPALVLGCVVACLVACTGGATAAGKIFGLSAANARRTATSPRHSGGGGQRPPSTADRKATPSPTASPAPSVAPARPSPHATASPSQQAAPLGVSRTVPASQLPPQVGALFDGGLNGSHHCTASVVNSPGENLIVTAAHCLGSTSDVFVPAYHDGLAPYGVWHLQRIVVDARWTDDSSPDDDVAFAVVAPLDGRTIQSVVGGYTLGIDHGTGGHVTITGYPETAQDPVTCTNHISSVSSTQNEIYCTGMTGGTSGSPWVTDDSPGTVMGVIGGYEQGGDTADASYSVAFGESVQSLYQEARSGDN